MKQPWRPRVLIGVVISFVIGAVVLASAGMFVARAADPIKIGFGMALTGGLSANGKPALLALQIWKDDINKKGGLLGRPVELVFYDDQTNPATVPGIYSKLLDVDKVDIVTSGYGTNLIAPLMPIAMERKLMIMGIFGLANNEKYKYPNYFQISPNGPEPETSTALGFFELAARQNPKPQTVAIVGADAEYPQNALVGARELIKKFGFKTVYDKTYPPSTTDYTPIVRAIKATNPDVVFVASYPPDSVGMLRAAHEVGLQPKLFGGGMVGLMFTSIMTSMGPMLNGVVNYDFWAPEPTFLSMPGIKEFLKEYQARAERGHQGPRPAEAGRLHPGHRVQHHRGQGEVRQERGVGQGAHPDGPVPEDPGQRDRSVPRAGQEGRALPRRVQVRQHRLPVLGGEELARVAPCSPGTCWRTRWSPDCSSGASMPR